MKRMLYEMLSGHRELGEDRVIALFCLKTGMREKTAHEYLQELKNAGVLESQEDKSLKIQKTLFEQEEN